ncbi:methylation-associated defense system protein MAD4 [Gaoshiqia sp. Z1-71]|uniref:methylation-associated defense system protein MAD4 n=1 Tax=Gaoshiqia hydrogeniformans TaxID=3290090 RepID=UPI003BF91F61
MKNVDIIILVADLNIKECIHGLLQRLPAVLGVNSFSYEIFVHPNRDPGCRLYAASYLRGFQNRYKYALVVFDRDGSGREFSSRLEIETELEKDLINSGWGNRAKAIVIEPELENWIWVKSQRLAQIINWSDIDKLYDWLKSNNFVLNESNKPSSPKEAFEKALYISKKKRSSSIYAEIASQVSFKHCTDQSFNKLIDCIKIWFSNKYET